MGSAWSMEEPAEVEGEPDLWSAGTRGTWEVAGG